jgi:hypothetical protein
VEDVDDAGFGAHVDQVVAEIEGRAPHSRAEVAEGVRVDDGAGGGVATLQRAVPGADVDEQFQSCVAALTNALILDGLLSGRERAAIQSCAGQANIP